MYSPLASAHITMTPVVVCNGVWMCKIRLILPHTSRFQFRPVGHPGGVDYAKLTFRWRASLCTTAFVLFWLAMIWTSCFVFIVRSQRGAIVWEGLMKTLSLRHVRFMAPFSLPELWAIITSLPVHTTLEKVYRKSRGSCERIWSRICPF